MAKKTIKVTAIHFCDGRFTVIPSNAVIMKKKLEEWRLSVPREKLDEYFTAGLDHGAVEFTMFQDEFIQKFGKTHKESADASERMSDMPFPAAAIHTRK